MTISKFSSNLSGLATLFPISLYKAPNFYDVKKESFEKYVIGKKCGSSLYNFKDCFETIGSTTHTKVCIYLFDIIHIIHAEDLVVVNSLKKL